LKSRDAFGDKAGRVQTGMQLATYAGLHSVLLELDWVVHAYSFERYVLHELMMHAVMQAGGVSVSFVRLTPRLLAFMVRAMRASGVAANIYSGERTEARGQIVRRACEMTRRQEIITPTALAKDYGG
jgi:hypothetical protein